MTDFDHVEFLQEVVRKHSLDVKIPSVSDLSFAGPIVGYFESETDGYSLLAMSMVAYLVDHCKETTHFDPLIQVAQELVSLVRNRRGQDHLEITAQEVRTVLFCEFIRNRDRRLLETESALLSSLTGGSYDAIRKSEFSLSHGVGQMLQALS